MSKVVVLGGCGAVGSVAARTLAAQPDFTSVVIADFDFAKARALAAEIAGETARLDAGAGEVDAAGRTGIERTDAGATGLGTVSAVEVDATDAGRIKQVIAGADVVLNCVGPFYKTVETVLAAVIESKIDYVDICDDVDVTLNILKMDDAAKRAGITALVGMGASPGATNLLATYVADNELDETDSVDIFHTHGGEPVEGAGVIGHRFHCMSIAIPMFLEGELRHVSYFGEDGIALRQDFDFPGIGPTPIFPYPHPEQVTLPRYLKVRQVTNKGSVLPIEYYDLTGELCRLGLASKEPIEVAGREVVPYDFAVAYLIRERERILKATKFGTQRGCMSVVLGGKKDGAPREVRVHMTSKSGGLGEGTGIPAAMGTLLVERGKVSAKGVLPPEACVDPADFITLAADFIPRGAGSGERGTKIFIENIGPDGTTTTAL
jgi:saccharopine dehydrogenase (NAD+, L-lysine-forming)